MNHPGYFITFEGPEGSGKSTQIRRLAGTLSECGIPVLKTFEPGGSKLGSVLRRWLLKPGRSLTVEGELLLFLADRAQHVAEVIRPALHKGCVVLCDRYVDSTLAYQGGGRGFPVPFLKRLNALATGGLKPDLTILLDLPVVEGMRRARKRGASDRMERQKQSFHERVRCSFKRLARDRRRFVTFDARRSPEAIARRILHHLEHRLPLSLRRRMKE